jgi:hypothetical protein
MRKFARETKKLPKNVVLGIFVCNQSGNHPWEGVTHCKVQSKP